MATAKKKMTGEGCFVLENKRGEVVRYFSWQSSKIVVVFRLDNKRVETFADVKELEDRGIPFMVLEETTQAAVKKSPVTVAKVGTIRYVEDVEVFSANYDLAPDESLEPKKALGMSLAIQLGVAGIAIILGALTGSKQKSPETTVTIIPQETVEKMLKQDTFRPPQPEEAPKAVSQPQPPPTTSPKNVVVAPSATKLKKNAPVPTRSTSFKKHAKASKKGPKGGGYLGEGPRGYGTNEPHMNSIGALGALTKTVKGGNGGSGGVNLQAVGTEPGSGAGGKGYGGFGSNGGGGRGKGGIGTGKGMGLSNAMYGKGLIAAPFGDGSPAPGSGGYGTRGKMGGGAQGAGYGTTTVVGSWKGTGPKGDGPAGSGAGTGLANGSPWGSVDGDDGDAIVTGGLDMEAVNAVIMRNMGQVLYCYEQGLQRNASMAGRVSMKWQINGGGRVSFAKVAHSSVRSALVESCIAGKIRNWKFPKPQGGVNVAVQFPFNLRRTVQR